MTNKPAISTNTALQASDLIDPRHAPQLVVPRNRRRPKLIALGVGLIMLFSLVGYWAIQETTSRSAVVGLATDVAYGEVLIAADLMPVNVVPDPGLRTVPWSSLSTLVGQRAATDLLAGSLLTSRSVTTASVTTEGQSLVGVTVKPSQSPQMSLLPRDKVQLVLLPNDSTAFSLTDSLPGLDAAVMSVGAIQSGGSRTVDVILPSDRATLIAAAAAAGRVAIVFVSRG